MREKTIVKARRTFTGRFRVTGAGRSKSVLVQFEAAVICAHKGDLPEEKVVETLLGELVQESLAGGARGRQH